jgi:hypothetical protein
MESAQSILNKIQWELASHNGKLTTWVLRRRMGIKYTDLDPVLEELERNGKIRRTEVGVNKDFLSR